MSDEKVCGVVFDFDGTLTPKAIGALYKVVDQASLPPEAETEYASLREKYLPKIRDGSLEPIDELYWLTETFEIYMRHDLARSAWESALEDVRLRSSVIETLERLRTVDCRIGIVSYGCADFIEFVLRRNHAAHLVDSVLGARLVHDDGGRIVGYDRTTLVYPDNKDVWSRRFAEAYGIRPAALLAVGDSGGDRKLSDISNRLGIAESEEQKAKLAKHFTDIVVIPDGEIGGFLRVYAWLRARIAS